MDDSASGEQRGGLELTHARHAAGTATTGAWPWVLVAEEGALGESRSLGELESATMLMLFGDPLL